MQAHTHKRPRFLDLYCGGGGTAMGYHKAGFDDITGVDIEPQPRYPFAFVQADALEYLAAHWQEYDAFHASPVCKGYSIMNNLPWLRGREYPYQILPTREMLQGIAAESGKPWVIENVYAARWGSKGLVARGLEAHGMQAGWLCGLMFGLPLFLHRLFESSFFWMAPGHPKHLHVIRAGHELKERLRTPIWHNGFRSQDAPQSIILDGHPSKRAVERLGEAKGITWMNYDELSQAIPPAYTEYIGKHLMAALHG